MSKDDIGLLGQESEKIREYRCSFCGKLFFRGLLRDGIIEIRCRNCKKLGILCEEKDPLTRKSPR